jgi:tight adherence protein C
VLLLIFVAVTSAAFLAAQVRTLPTRQTRAALERAVAGARARRAEAGDERSFRERVLQPAAARLAGMALRLSPNTSLELIRARLLAAGMRDASPTAFLAVKGAAVAGGLLLGVLVGVAGGGTIGLGVALVFTGLAFVVPDRVVAARARKWREEIQKALPGALELLAVSIEAGLAFDAAVAELTEHLEGPLVEELRLMLSEMRIGRSRQDALRSLADRVEAPELTAFVRAVVQAEQLGASMSHILSVQAEDSRARRQAAAEEKAMKAPVKMLFPTVLFIFPSMFLVILGPALLNFAKLF